MSLGNRWPLLAVTSSFEKHDDDLREPVESWHSYSGTHSPQSRQESVRKMPVLTQGRSSVFRLKHLELGHGTDRAGMVSGFPELGVTAKLPWNMRDFSLTHSSRANTRRIRKVTEMKVTSDS